MHIHLVTVGKPKLAYAQAGWDEYLARLGQYHKIRGTPVADKWAQNSNYLLQVVGKAYLLALAIEGQQYSSLELASFLEKRALEGREVCFLVGGPEGLPQPVIDQADTRLSLSRLTFPHDLAMVILAEALYRASSLTAGHPYHK